MVDMSADPIALVPSRYPAWRRAYFAEHDRIYAAAREAGLLDAVSRIAHVGSTAVPNLAAKDIVDINVVVAADAVAPLAETLATELGGTRSENAPTWQPIAREQAGQRFNDHVFAAATDRWRVSVVTRDVLRARPALRSAYQELKAELAAETDDLETYSVGKSGFIEDLLQTAREDGSIPVACHVPAPE